MTALFLGGAWLFASRGLQFSAEAVGALGMVFLALDVWAFADAAPDGVNGWAFAGIGTLVASSLMIAIAALVRLRVWLWLSIIGLTLTPAFFGYATENWWGATIGHLGAAFVALGAHELAGRLSGRFGSELKTDRFTATVLQFAAAFIVVVAIIVPGLLPEPVTGVVGWTFGVASILGGLAVMAGLSTRNEAAAAWSLLTGALAVTTIAILPHAFEVNPSEWEYLALLPLAAAIAFVAAAAVRQTGTIHRMPFLAGGLAIAVLAAVPAVFTAIGRLGAALFSALVSVLNSDDWWQSSPEVFIAATAGVASAAVGAWGASRFTSGGLSTGLATLALWLGGLALLTAAVWPSFQLEVRVAAELTAALLVSLALLLVPRFRSSRLLFRVPVIMTAFSGLVIGVAMSWEEQVVAVIAGAAALGVLVAIAYTVSRAAHPFLMGLGFAYALVIFANALDLTTLETLPILCLTATFGSTVALAATLTPWLRPGTWYAVLIVTTIPFLIAVGVLFVEIRGWTALSTGVTFLLALALVITRRPGLTVFLRAAAAALLVPSLSVVVIALGAQLLDVSASPITLPIIAVVVAAVLPTTGLIASALVKNGLSEGHARAVRLWIEISTLVTGAIAVILAFVRDAAGPNTAFLVFVIVGIGAAATAIWARRRYGWIVAGIAWTGALWTALGILDVSVDRHRAVRPAAGARRGRRRGDPGCPRSAGRCRPLRDRASRPPSRRRWSCSRSAGPVPGVGAPLARVRPAGRFRAPAGARRAHPGWDEEKPNRFLPLRSPTLVIAIAAAASGAIQGIRYGSGIEALPAFLDPAYVMLTVLAFALRRDGPRDGCRSSGGHGTGSSRAAGALVVPGRRGLPGRGADERDQPDRARHLDPVVAHDGAARATRRDRPACAHPCGDPAAGLVHLRARLGRPASPAGASADYIRLEGWSIPMGVALLAAGVIAMPKLAEQFGRVNLNSWPIGFRGSWRCSARDPGARRAVDDRDVLHRSVDGTRHPRHRARAGLRAGGRVPPAAGRRSSSASSCSRSRSSFVFAVQIGRGVRVDPVVDHARRGRRGAARDRGARPSAAPARTPRSGPGSAIWSSRARLRDTPVGLDRRPTRTYVRLRERPGGGDARRRGPTVGAHVARRSLPGDRRHPIVRPVPADASPAVRRVPGVRDQRARVALPARPAAGCPELHLGADRSLVAGGLIEIHPSGVSRERTGSPKLKA